MSAHRDTAEDTANSVLCQIIMTTRKNIIIGKIQYNFAFPSRPTENVLLRNVNAKQWALSHGNSILAIFVRR